jgi:hypothetical protein
MVMPDDAAVIHQCPGCGLPVEPGDVYVVALEYELEPGFSLHRMAHDSGATAERRFHVEHFRARIGDSLFALIHEQTSVR